MNITLTNQQSDRLHQIAVLQGHGSPEAALEFLIDQAAEGLCLDHLAKAADLAVKNDGLIPSRPMTYGEWLEWTGRDDSFVGDGLDIPGTADLYDAAIYAFEAASAVQS